MKQKFLAVKNWVMKLSLLGKILLIVAVLGSGWLIKSRVGSPGTAQPVYQTAPAEKGTLIQSITASGQVSSTNTVQITTQVTGVVKTVYVKNGDTVKQGQKIATLVLDQSSQQRAVAASASYQQAKNQLDSAQAKLNSLQAALFKANQTFMNGAVANGRVKEDPNFIQENALWLQAEADYKNQTAVIAQAQTSLASAALSLSQTAATITAPAAGTIKGLTISAGTTVTSSSNSSSSTTAQVLGAVAQAGPIQAQVNISEVDVVKVNEGQKVTLTLDAFPTLTFTGKVASINTNGVTSSGVTTYPTVIAFDTGHDKIYPNMAVNAKIMTLVKPDVIVIPSAAIQTSNGTSTVQVMRGTTLSSVTVEVGDTNDTQTEVVSGVQEGDTIVTGSTVTGVRTTTTTGTTSPFSSVGGQRGGFGGATVGGAAPVRRN